MRRTAVLSALMLALLLALFVPRLASAHARFVRSNPEDGAVLAELPREVRLWFDESITVAFCSAQLLDASGHPVGVTNVRGDPTDSTALIVELPPAGSGLYSLTWKIVSALDTHRTQGTLVFGVNTSVESMARAAPVEPPPPLVEVGLRALTFAAYALSLGGLFSAGRVLRSRRIESEAWMTLARKRAFRVALIGLGALFVAGALMLAWQAATLERGSLGELLSTRYGALWLAQEGLTLIGLMAVLAAQRNLIWGWWGGGLAGAGLAAVLALNSHAAGAGTLAIIVQTVHLLTACGWVGSVIVLALALWPLHRALDDSAQAAARDALRGFGQWAVAGVGVLAATGLYNTARQVVSADAWLLTSYGQALLFKVAAFLLVGLMGFVNASLLHPRVAAVLAALLRRPANWTLLPRKRLSTVLWAEVALGVTVLALTGWLTALPPARGAEFVERPPVEKPLTSLTRMADDLTINLQIRPNKPGPNLLTVGVLNTRRPAPAEVLRVLVRLTYVEQDLGQQILIADAQDADHYGVSTSALSVAGRWKVQVVVRRYGMEDSVADFDWRVEALAPAIVRPVLVSQKPLATWLDGLAAIGMGAVVLLGVIALFRRHRNNK
jgi:copper transport protein